MKRCALLLAVACGSSSTQPPVGTRVGPALSAALTTADQNRAPVRCSGTPPTTSETFKLKGRTWQLSGNTLSVSTEGPFTIGVIADTGGAAPATLAAIGKLHDPLARVDLILAEGGIGATADELEAVLGLLATDGIPVVALAGDLEPASALAHAITALRARNRIVLDARAVRWIEIADQKGTRATIGTLPGASSAVRLAAGADGCGYSATDVSAILDALTKKPGLRILATSEAPRTELDHEAAGTLAVTPKAGQEIDIILHGPVTPEMTPPANNGRDGKAEALSPGTADATTRLPGGPHTSIGALRVGVNLQWVWEVLR